MSKTEFDLIQASIRPHDIGARTESVALLAWFLQHVWRMEPEDVDDAICDGGGDKGIDALAVDDDLAEITIFQSKHRKVPKNTQGDSDLKDLVGSAVYFEDAGAIDRLLKSKPNPELTRLLLRLDVRQKVADGAHAARLVFVTNALLDAAGDSYLKTVAGREPSLDVWDRARVSAVAARTREPELLQVTKTLIAKGSPTVVSLDGATHLAVALIPAKALVGLPGLGDLTLFDPNVRLGLGRTRINRELAKTILAPDEHAFFPAYHNGLTMLTDKLTVRGTKVTLEGISVVNGCQSLLTLAENEQAITDDLNLLVKIVQVDTRGDLADKITYRTNNQNSVDIRDQRSRDPIQRDLQAEVASVFGATFGLTIRRGEPVTASENISNEAAAQLIMAVYLGEPWNAVRKVRLFDHDYRRIFSRAVDAHQLYLLYVTNLAIESARGTLRSDLASSFSSVRFTLAYLLAEVLKETDEGRNLLENPALFLPQKRTEVEAALGTLAQEVAESTNSFVENEEAEAEENGENFDPKVVFKSRSGVNKVTTEVIRLGRRLAKSDPTYFFSIKPR